MKSRNIVIIICIIIAGGFIFLNNYVHHPREKFVNDFIQTNNIDSFFDAEKEITWFFLDSVLKNTKPSLYFSGCMEDFKNNKYSIVPQAAGLFPKNYSLLTINEKIYLEISAAPANENKIMRFYFLKKNKTWVLAEIGFG